jgi:hypothetical protein
MHENPYQAPQEKPIDRGRSVAVNYFLGYLYLVFALLGLVFFVACVIPINLRPHTGFAVVIILVVVAMTGVDVSLRFFSEVCIPSRIRSPLSQTTLSAISLSSSMTTEAISAASSPSYSWRRFSLRALMLLIAIIALWCGWVVSKARFYREQRAYLTELQTRFPNTVTVKSLENEWFWRPLVGDAAVTVRRAALSNYRFEQARYELTETDLPWIRHWTAIEGLHLGGPAITDETISLVRRMPHLKALDLQNTAITDAGTKYIASLNGLESLGIYTIRDRASTSGAGITDASLKHLLVGKDFRLLALTGPISDEGLALIADALPKLEILQLYESRITGEGLRHVPRLAKLQQLRLSDNASIDDSSIMRLADWPHLGFFLWLERTAVTDHGATALVDAAPGMQVRLESDDYRGSFRAR